MRNRPESNAEDAPSTRWCVLERALPWAMALVAIAVLLRSNTRWLTIVVSLLDHCPEPGCDFVHHYMPQARQLFTEPGDLVFGWVYPPLLALVLQPLRLLSDAAALDVWMNLQVVLVVVLLLQCRAALRGLGRAASWAGAFGLVALSLPVLHSVKWGQVSLAVGVGSIAALARPRCLAAPILGLLAGLKLYPILYLVLPWLRRDRRAVAAAVGWALACGLVLPLLLVGPRTTESCFRAVLDVRMEEASYLGGQALGPAIQRWFVTGRHVGLESAGTRPLVAALGDSRAVAWALYVLPAAVVAGLTVLRLRRIAAPASIGATAATASEAGAATRHAAALLLVGTGLCLPPGWHHYFAFVPWALAVVLGHARCGVAQRALVFVAWAATALPPALLADVSGVYFRASAWGCTTFAAFAAWLALATLHPGPLAGLGPACASLHGGRE